MRFRNTPGNGPQSPQNTERREQRGKNEVAKTRLLTSLLVYGALACGAHNPAWQARINDPRVQNFVHQAAPVAMTLERALGDSETHDLIHAALRGVISTDQYHQGGNQRIFQGALHEVEKYGPTILRNAA